MVQRKGGFLLEKMTGVNLYFDIYQDLISIGKPDENHLLG